MTLIPVDVEILSTTFEVATRHDDQFVARFYSKLLAEYPRVERLFAGQTVGVAQQRMLARAVVTSLAHLDDPAWLLTTLPALGRQHQRLGVEVGHFEGFVTCFIETLALACGDAWSIRADEEWTAAFTVITTLMMSGYHEA